MRTLQEDQKLIQRSGQYYVVTECNNDCPPFCICKGQKIASVNYWPGLGNEYEFRYDIWYEQTSAMSGKSLYPGVDIEEYCHKENR